MTLSEIRDECRELARDTSIDDRLWSDAEINRYINRVYWRIATETRCIKDSTTPSVCLLTSTPVVYTTYVAGTLDYLWANDTESWLYHRNVSPYLFNLHASIITVDEVKWVSRQWKLRKVSCEKWRTNPWWERVVGLPTEFAVDYQNGKLAVNFRDEVADTMQLSVTRAPLVKLIEPDDVPEFRENYHEFFINGVLHYMYSKMDSEAYDKDEAAKYYGRFLADIDEVKQQESQLNAFLRPNYSMNAFR